MSAEHYEQQYTDHFPADSWPRALEQARTSRDADAALELLIAMAREHAVRPDHTSGSSWSDGWGTGLARLLLGRARTLWPVGRDSREALKRLSKKCGGWWEWDSGLRGPVVVRRHLVDVGAPVFIGGSVVR